MTGGPVGLALVGLDLRETYLATATAFQLLLALLTVAIPERDELRWGIGLVLAIGGLETLHFLGQSTLGVGVPQPGIRMLDTLLVFTLAMLALGFPRPPRAFGRRRARLAWALGAVAIVAVNGGLAVTSGVEAALQSTASRSLRTASFCLATAVGALHVVPRFLELSPGPLRRQTVVAAGGLLLSPLFVAAGYLPGIGSLPTSVEVAFHVASAWFAAALVLRALAGLVKPDRDRAAFAAILAAGLGLGLVQKATASGVLPQVAAHLLRPLLLGGAMLRFDLFRVHERLRGWTLPALTVLGTALAFLLVAFFVTPGGASGTAVPPVGALAAATLLVAGGVAWLALDPDGGPARPGLARLERYRLGLERHRAGGSDGEPVTRLRAQLGVTAAEHRVLERVLDERPLVSTGSLGGAEAGDTVAGRYEVDRELGRGGAGRALVAWDREEERSVVLKEVLRPWEAGADARRRALEREVEIARAVDAPSLAGVHGLVREGPRWYLVREHVPGRPLDRVVDEEGPLSPERVRAIVASVGEGLVALHDEGLLHLDVKPSNVVLRDDGRAVLVDQGTAQWMPGTDGDDRSHRTATIGGSGRRGTLAWMAPEQVLEREVTPRTDVFALGALTYHLATGREHVDTDRPAFEVEDEIVHGVPPEDPPAPLADGIRAALARAPEDRPSSVAELLELLGAEPPAPPRSSAEDEEASTDADDVPGG